MNAWCHSSRIIPLNEFSLFENLMNRKLGLQMVKFDVTMHKSTKNTTICTTKVSISNNNTDSMESVGGSSASHASYSAMVLAPFLIDNNDLQQGCIVYSLFVHHSLQRIIIITYYYYARHCWMRTMSPHSKDIQIQASPSTSIYSIYSIYIYEYICSDCKLCCAMQEEWVIFVC